MKEVIQSQPDDASYEEIMRELAFERKVSKISGPTIEQVLEKFLTEQRKGLKPKTVSAFREVIQLLMHYMDGYAYQGLTKAESALFEEYSHIEGKEPREFCQIFGPEKIVIELGGFLGDYMPRKVAARGDFKGFAGTVIKDLSKWLAEKGYISEEAARMGIEKGASAADNLPKAEKATYIIYRDSEHAVFSHNKLDDDDYHEFNHYTIEKVEPGKLWLEVLTERCEGAIGPVAVPKAATKLIQEGWYINCALARIRGKWTIIEFGGIYPI